MSDNALGRADIPPSTLNPRESALSPQLTPFFVGRAAELEYLEQCLAAALTGKRQIIFVTGDPGIGKTTLLDAFLERLKGRDDVRVTHGQCVEQYGAGEAYLPLLEATTRLCRAPGGEPRVEGLRRYAPSWLAHLPSLVDPLELAQLQQHAQGASRERMLREMAEAAELFSGRRGLVVVLEDLHWSDAATLEWLAYMARRREAAKLFILGTYRPADMLTSDLPLKSLVQELLVRGQCEELRLAPLDERAVHAYITTRLTGAAVPPAWTTTLHRRTAGNPLFLVNMLDYFIQQGAVIEEDGQWRLQDDSLELASDLPDTLRRLIEKQLERLTEDEQQLLEVASVDGREFAAAAVAVGLQAEIAIVEERCERLARKGQFISGKGVDHWPDDTIGGRYSFLHALYQNVLYERIAEARRVRLHRVLGMRKEQAYGERAREIAGELAVHFAAGRDSRRAVTYSKQAAETAVRRHAHQEAVVHLRQGLTQMQRLPDTPERAQQELLLQLTLGEQLTSLQGFGVEEVERAFARALELCRRLGETPRLFRVLLGLWAFYVERAELTTARELAEQLLRLAEQVKAPAMLTWANLTMGITSHFAGEQPAARQYLEQCLSLYDPQDFRAAGAPYDPAVLGGTTLGPVLWLLGYPEQALARSLTGLELAHELAQPYSVIYAANLVTRTRLLRGERQHAHAQVEALIALCREQGFLSYLALSLVVKGWLLAEQGRRNEGIEQVRREMITWRATGAESARPYYLALLAELHGKAGAPDEGLAVLSECWPWMEKTKARVFEPELYRLKGELTLQKETRDWGLETSPSSPQASSLKPQASEEVVREAEGYFHKALVSARQQQVKSLELRAAMSLARFWRGQGKIADAKNLLEEIHGWFTEGFETKDLQDAAALLTELGGEVRRVEDKKQTAKLVSTQDSALDAQHSLSTQHSRLDTQDLHSPSPSPQPLTPNLFSQEGEYWSLAFAGMTCRLRDTRGLHYLAQLLQHPNEEIHSLQIAADEMAQEERLWLESASRGALNELIEAEGKPSTGFSDAGEMLDPQARIAYKRRTEELRAELAEARAANDHDRTAALQAEMDFLTRELSQAVGLGGRVRKTGAVAERARVNVTKALKTAIREIGKIHPPLGRHLRQTIRTGTYCAYVPDPHSPITWQT